MNNYAIEHAWTQRFQQRREVRDAFDGTLHNTHKQKLEAIESALEEYFLFAYNKDAKDIERIAKSMHNFRLKGFERVEYGSNITHYNDKGNVFLVVEGFGGLYEIRKLWEYERK